MPVTKRTPPGEEPPKKPSTQNGTPTEGPWKEGPNGEKLRNGRALPFENKLKELLIGVGTVMSFKDEYVGTVMQNQAPEIAYGWAKLASEEPRVKRALEVLLTGSAWQEAIMPTATLAIAVLWHYGIFVPDKIGAPVSLMVGAIPISREQENELKSRAEAEAQQAAAAEAQRQAAEEPGRSGTAAGKADAKRSSDN